MNRIANLSAAVALALAGACGGANNGQLRDLERRVASLEATQARAGADADTAKAIEDATRRIEAVIRAIEAAQADMNRQLIGVSEQVSALEQRVGDAGAPPGRPPASPPNRPEPAEIYSVPVGDSPARGPRDAAVTMVIGTEFDCPYCERVRPTLEQLVAKYGDDLRIVYKSFIVHPRTATTPALAACAAHMQGKFFEFEAALWAKGFRGPDLNASNVEAIAKAVGLRMRAFQRDMTGRACQKKIDADQELLSRVGTRGTPSFYINGRYLAGAQPVESFSALIDEELAKAQEAFAAGVKKRNYYKSIVDRGKKSL